MGPFKTPPFDTFQINPIGLVEKKEAGKFRMIVNLSCPDSSSVNAGIPDTQAKVHYAIIEEASNITKDIQNIEIRTQICNAVHIHFKLNSTFDLIHQTISHSKAITDKEIDLAENFIESYIQQIREHDRVVPKSHLLEHHVVPWL